MTEDKQSVAEIAAGLSEGAREAVLTAGKTVTGGTRVSYRTSQEVWHELEQSGLLTPRTTPCLISSYLSEAGIALRAHLASEVAK